MSATPDRRSMLSQSHPLSAQPRRSQTRPTEVPSLPDYVAPEAPLTAEAQRHLEALISNHHHRNLITHLKHAAEKLTHSGGEVNERLADARGRFEKNKYQRRQRKGLEEGDDDEDEDEEEYQRLAEEETRVNAITARMEEKARLIVDAEVKLQGLTDAVAQLERQEGEAVAASLGSRRTRSGRNRRRGNDDDEDGDGEGEDDADYEDAQERETQERNARNPPSRRLEDKIAEGSEKWNEMSLTERYAGHNHYIGFYRMVHDSKFPGDDVPPLPHSSTWFQHMEDTGARSGGARTRNQRRHSPADDDDIAIERERISLKCPLTLLPFQDPVTSTKCPHSFEREPIFDMIHRSPTTIPPPAARRGQRRIHVIKCPVCSTPLTADDLNPDPVLLRRVRRAQELEEQEEDEDHLGNGRVNKRRNSEISVASDDSNDVMDVDAPEPSQRIKAERLSQPAPMPVDSESGEEEQSGETSEDSG
ncbi:hypothetical protein PENANT_c016G09145 [Penicillium antarcticum]|uniref:SP-RING-type domain-containing protein n=1 Tax=Penicillium antarcticum TaxID=416450 RepID=A0A1V6Q2J9_9EURO|nr:uncharacterized protein N7508_001375 [Penicillium antarcticum]KAJ5316867.1 hypothetical protein N7508_001375 [Penicillium antarcticum]OQD83483.1 hypothetical protein PENANT_c016G09145 [Penicillium antarcticum]